MSDMSTWRLSALPKHPIRPEMLAISAIIGAGLGLRIVKIDEQWLWYDDVFGPVFALQSIFDMMVCVARFDIHPPLWNVQLWLWAQIAHSDTWFMLNSVVWSVLCIPSLYWATRSRFGPVTALIAAGVFAFSPLSVTFAQQVRMYPMLMFLLIWAWSFNHRYLAENGSKRSLFAVAGLGIALTYTHGSGLILAFYIGVYGLVAIWRYRPERERLKGWLIAQTAVVLLGLPAIANAMVRSVAHLSSPSLESIFRTLSSLHLGPGYTGVGEGWRITWVATTPVPQIATAVLTIATVSNLLHKRSRLVTLALVVVPFSFALALSLTIKPIWYLNTFVPLLPFLALNLALFLATWVNKLPQGINQAPAMVLTILATSLFTFGTGRYINLHRKLTDFESAVYETREKLEPGDVLWAPLNFDYWAVAWYFKGHDWGSPLAVQDLEGPRQGKWKQILEKTNPDTLDMFHLRPKTNYVEVDGIRLYIGHSAREEILASNPPHVYVFQTDLMEPADWSDEDVTNEVNLDFTKVVEIEGYVEEEKHGYTRLWVKTFVPAEPGDSGDLGASGLETTTATAAALAPEPTEASPKAAPTSTTTAE